MKFSLAFTVLLLVIVPTFGQLYTPKHKVTKKYFPMTFGQANWYKSFHHCRSLGMNLVSITSKDENDRIIKQLRDEGNANKAYWTSGMNLFNNGNDFHWMGNGKSVTFENWGKSAPSRSIINGERENCLQITSAVNEPDVALKWNDRICTDSLYFICEQEVTEYEYCSN